MAVSSAAPPSALRSSSWGWLRSEAGSGFRDCLNITAFGRLSAITDDTQMTLFTAEGLIRAEQRFRERGIGHPPGVVYYAYHRWPLTQGETSPHDTAAFDLRSGWLIGEAALHSRRAPGTTCLSALRGPTMGTTTAPLNDSKGCGGVMRVAPVGLVSSDPFDEGIEIAALTHGHPAAMRPPGRWR